MAELHLHGASPSTSRHQRRRVLNSSAVTAALVIVACAMLACACAAAPQASQDQPPASQPGVGSRPAPATVPATQPTIAGSLEGSEPVITLLEAGVEPRASLRRLPTKGDVSACEIVTNLKIVMEMGQGATGTQNLPDTRRVLQMRVSDVNAAGDASFELDFTESGVLPTPTVPESSVEVVRGDVAAIAGSRGTGVMTARGMVRRSGVALPLDANPGIAPQIDQVLKTLDQLSVAFPSEPVGVGARWRIEADQVSEGIRSRCSHEVTLRKIDGSRVSVDIVISETAAPQDLTNRPLPPGATLHLDSLKINGRGAAVIDLTHLALVSGQSTVNSETTLTAIEPGTYRQTIVQKMQIGTIVTPATAENRATQPAAR